MTTKNKTIKVQTDSLNEHIQEYRHDLEAAKREIENDIREAQKYLERAKTIRESAAQYEDKGRSLKEGLIEKKKDIIMRLAKKLVKYHIVEKTQVGTRLRNDLEGYISHQWIRLVLPSEYKNPEHQHDTTSKKQQTELVNHAQNAAASSTSTRTSPTMTEEEARRVEQARQYNEMAVGYKDLLAEIDSLVRRLTGLGANEIASIINNTPKGESPKRYLMQKTTDHRFKLAKGLNTWGLRKHLASMQELFFVLDDAIKQFDNELEVAEQKPMGQ